MSVPEHFFDTNILLYLLSGDDAKADAAEALIAKGGHLSVQVLNEFASVATRKLNMTHAEVRDVLATIRREFRSDRALRIRQFVERKEANDRRVGYKPRNANRRVVDRRAPQKGLVIYRVLSAAGESSVLLQCKA